MEENLQKTYHTDAKKCCTKGIIILVISCLVCFFVGYYSGYRVANKHLKALNRTPFARSVVRKPVIKQPTQVGAENPTINSKIRKPVMQNSRKITKSNVAATPKKI